MHIIEVVGDALSNPDLLDLVEVDLVASPVIELGRLRGFVVDHPQGVVAVHWPTGQLAVGVE